jgi:hypothetical protein
MQRSIVVREAVFVPERNVAQWSGGEPATIWYFGDSYSVWIKLHEQVTNGHRLAPVGDVINRWAKQLTEPLCNLDAAVAIDDPLAWAASGIGCRGRFESPVTGFACCFAAFLEAMEAGGRHVFVVGDEDLGRAMYETARERGWAVGWGRPGATPRRRWLGLVFQIAHTLRGRVTGLRHYGRRRRQLRRLRRRYPLEAEKLRKADTLIVLWGRANTFSPHDRRVHDGWFVDLPALLQNAGRRLAYLIQPLDWADSYEAIAANALASGEPVLMIEDACTFGDMLRAAIATLRRPARPLRLQVHGGPDLTPVLRAALWREVRHDAPTLAHLQSGVGPFLRRLGMRPRTLVHLYEGQPWERSLRMSIRRALPETRVVAVQHMPFPPLYLNFVPSIREIASGELPDTLMVLGPSIVDFFQGLGFPDKRLAVGGALRFKSVKSLAGGGHRSALCGVGVDWHESHELADKAAQAVARFPELRLIINFNPLAPQELKSSIRTFVLDRLQPDARARVEFSDLGIRDLISSVGLVLYSDTNAAYEAFAAGCELIFIGRDHALDYDKLPPGWATHCRSVDEIAAALQRWLSQPAPADRDERLRWLGNYLGDVDAGAFLSRI